MDENYDFPSDLRETQIRLHRANAEYEALARELPWSVEPMPGWSTQTTPNARDTVIATRPPSPGYTEEQKAEVKRLRALLLELSTRVGTHPFRDSVGKDQVHDARMALKHAHEAPDGDEHSGDCGAAA
ncbi:hypothetical protein [Streptomyces syringium]|uniref:hypothetical protein n=1 Tax=Streptomyces syringium TaxID=76729 RepID=UPI0037CFC246